MEEKANDIIKVAIENRWKRIYLQNLDLLEIPVKLAEIEDIELIDLRGNRISKLPEWIKLKPDFETALEEGCPTNSTIYLYGNHIISVSEIEITFIEGIEQKDFDLLVGYFESMVQRVKYLAEYETTDKDKVKEYIEYLNLWDDRNVILQRKKGLLKIAFDAEFSRIRIFSGDNKLDSTEMMERILLWANIEYQKLGSILHPCGCKNCQNNPQQRFLFDHKFLDGFYKKYLPNIQCHQSGEHLRLDFFAGLYQPKIQVFVDYAEQDGKKFTEINKLFPKRGWDYRADIWHPWAMDAGVAEEVEFQNSLNRGDVLIFFLSKDFVSDDKKWERLKNHARPRWIKEDVLLLIIESSPCHWEEGFRDFPEDEIPKAIKLEHGNWHQVSIDIHSEVEKWLKNKRNASN